MLYAFLCYNNEDTVFSWSQEQDAAVMSALHEVHAPLEKAGRFGPSVRLMPTTAAMTTIAAPAPISQKRRRRRRASSARIRAIFSRARCCRSRLLFGMLVERTGLVAGSGGP